MGVKTVTSHSKYLGLPVVFRRSKKEVIAQVVERVWKKIKGWKEKFLSKAKKEVFIKAVAQVIPSYIMSFYKIPESICHEIESMLAKFWWGSKNGERKLHWMSRGKMEKEKNIGGLGFEVISEFNTSLIGKQYRCLLTGPYSLVGRVLNGRYYPRYSIDSSTTGYSPSYSWRNIISSRDLIQKGACWRIGNGEKVSSF
ncbi:uncharacterized mitochondrial protein AtMg00310-like [Vicia villosa]|uniref:uncharacterized mitochondrial protein AtMg00310-like n=1 Tax=Vicia villosa TaxID=3911 RepID=UPI00273BFEFC|nr:uncharacterized mitochondrial protein AtMg00310-like [Vicia villosa]